MQAIYITNYCKTSCLHASLTPVEIVGSKNLSGYYTDWNLKLN